jgi:gluconate 2-dehydrogenase gamma chain
MSHDPTMLHRREILRRAAWILGGAISAPAALAILQGCSAKEPDVPAKAAATRFLTAAELALVAEIAEIMIPRTDTSGARDAGVPAFIDAALEGVYPAADRDRFRAGGQEFEARLKDGKSFLEREPAERVGIVRRALENALSTGHDPKPFILMTRELALLGYFTSRVGINDNMEYVAVPKEFHACVPVAQMRKPVYWE